MNASHVPPHLPSEEDELFREGEDAASAGAGIVEVLFTYSYGACACTRSRVAGATITRLPDGKLGKLRVYKSVAYTTGARRALPFCAPTAGPGRCEWRLAVSPFALTRAAKPSSSRTPCDEGPIATGPEFICNLVIDRMAIDALAVSGIPS